MKLEMDMSGLVAKLEACRVEVATEGKKKALRAGGRVIREAMESRAPVLEKTAPGSSSLDPGALKAGMRVLVAEVNGEMAALIGPSAKVEHVARWVEYGHRMVKGGRSQVLANGKTRGPGKASEVDVPAHPFLRPAYEESVGAANEAIAESLAETIQRVVR